MSLSVNAKSQGFLSTTPLYLIASCECTGLTKQPVSPATYHPSSLSNSSILIVSCSPPGSCTRGVWSVSHTIPPTFVLCCSFPPSDCYGAITSRRPVVRTAVKYRRLATGRLYGTSLPFRRFLTSSPVEFLPPCIHKTGKCRKKGEIYNGMSHYVSFIETARREDKNMKPSFR
jgi:hypothetical protein